ncbi:hypothetical protein KGA66_17035 [Actinocrinis puniceicyclus]|uniref:Uncharacterized protein n=1 Tax=Actinocrinis puniceicyclus TaxID=977794 RepID=A0A8J7WLU7_9ACTN|nr:hypothetical protein [Actinocrinis puniceicyclus]MBS2964766.1 hypothetical protein [Actinocrinis puniceicyclus]
MSPLLIASLAYGAAEARHWLRDLSRGCLAARVIGELHRVGGGHVIERRRGCEIQVTVHARNAPRSRCGTGRGPGRTAAVGQHAGRRRGAPCGRAGTRHP